jgi:predicted Zn finger-like uncharacterized protein
VKFICDQCKAKYQIADDKIAGKTVRMKCRKCGHQIEVRAEVTESSVASHAPIGESPRPPGALGSAAPGAAPGAKAVGTGPAAPRPAQKPAAPRVGPLATSLAAAKPAPPRAAPLAPARPGVEKGALAGAFKSSVTKEEEISASFDLAELSAADEWYVAINGVPVGPIRIAEVRRKAALGAVTEDSLVWQEGLEEWRPVRAFAELAAVVLEAASAGRNSLLTPAPPEGRQSARPAPPRSTVPPRATPGPSNAPHAPHAAPRAPAAAIAARSNVVAITSRLATAERIDDATVPVPEAARDSRVMADPFAIPPAAGVAALSPSVGSGYTDTPPPPLAAIAASAVPATDPSARKAPPWIAIAMVVLAAAFGITAALALFLRQPAAAPQPVVIQMPSGAAPVAPPTSTQPNATVADNDPASPLPQTSGTAGPKGPVAFGTGTGAKPPPTASTGGFSLSGGLGVNRPAVDPNATSGSDPKQPGQCLSQSQIQGVIGQHRIGVSRVCWDKSSSARQSVNVGVTVTIGPGGEVQNVSANGEDNSVANCVANDVRNWHFPGGGCVQQTFFSLKFLRQ